MRWEGQLVSLTGATKGYPTLAEAEADGLFHPNCTHRLEFVSDDALKEAQGGGEERGAIGAGDANNPSGGDDVRGDDSDGKSEGERQQVAKDLDDKMGELFGSRPYVTAPDVYDVLRDNNVLDASDKYSIDANGKVTASPEVKGRIAAWMMQSDNAQYVGREIEARKYYGLHAYKTMPSFWTRVNAVNPKYLSGGDEYLRNCQRCIFAYALQCRGINAEASPRIVSGHDPVERHWWKPLGKGSYHQAVKKTSVEALRRDLIAQGKNSMGAICAFWKGSTSGHGVNYEVRETSKGLDVIMIDSQCHASTTLTDWLQMHSAEIASVRYARMDDIQIFGWPIRDMVKPPSQ